jgi:hypothetical protein
MDKYDINLEIPRIGTRAEILAAWYMRFNGFFIVRNFIIHDAGLFKQAGGQLSEADFLAIRMPYEHEVIKGDRNDIFVQKHKALAPNSGVFDFVIGEVSSKQCKFNWMDIKNQSINKH